MVLAVVVLFVGGVLVVRLIMIGNKVDVFVGIIVEAVTNENFVVELRVIMEFESVVCFPNPPGKYVIIWFGLGGRAGLVGRTGRRWLSY